ncbi:hypothetical protein C0J52_00674 [Blattella germanica]|nr:hypothetical protein C0J52_00674 [Blattella germanica]
MCFEIHNRWAGHVARMGDERGVRKILEGKPEGKRPIGRPRMKEKFTILNNTQW